MLLIIIIIINITSDRGGNTPQSGLQQPDSSSGDLQYMTLRMCQRRGPEAETPDGFLSLGRQKVVKKSNIWVTSAEMMCAVMMMWAVCSINRHAGCCRAPLRTAQLWCSCDPTRPRYGQCRGPDDDNLRILTQAAHRHSHKNVTVRERNLS